MKSSKAILATAFSTGVLAQTNTGVDGLVTVTSYTSDCSTLYGPSASSGSYTATTTGTVTDTLPCDECEMTSSNPGIWTTYTTVYQETCSSGLAEKTYTITESCSEENQPRPSTYVPTGFTVTTVECEPCEHKTVTLTTPCETESATSTPTPAGGAPTSPAPAPATTAPPPAGPTGGSPPPANSALTPAPSAPAPAGPPAYVGIITSTTACNGCGEGSNGTSAPIQYAKASTTDLNSIMTLIALVAGLFMAL